MKITDFLKKINPNGINTIEEIIYQHYSNTFEKDENKETIDLKVKNKQKTIINIDKGWIYRNASDNYLIQQNKYLVYKAGQSLMVAPQNFLINYTFENKNFTYVDINFKAYEESNEWVWFYSKNFLNFQNIIRLYFSFEKGVSIKIRGFIHDLTKILELKQIPSQLKIEVQLSFRHENAVLYFQQEHYFLVFVIVRYLHIKYSKKKNIFRDVGPLFTFDTKLRGVHFAEDPNESGLSFGKKRSKLLAELYKYNIEEEAGLEKILKKKGYNWKEFYRNPFQKYPYCFRIFKNAKISDKYISTLGIWEQRFKSSYFPALNIVLDISKIILKNAIFSTSKNKMRVDWLKGMPDPFLSKSVSYRICSDSEKIEVIDFLSRLYLLSVNDVLLKITCSIALDCIDKANLSSPLQILFDAISARINDKVGSSLEIIMSLDNSDKIRKTINGIKNDFEKRGAVSWLPDDAFNPTMSDYGYSFIGTKILEEITKQN